MRKLYNYDRIAELNKSGFGYGDYYSKAEKIENWVISGEGWTGITTVTVKGIIAGFSMWEFYDGAIHTARRAVDKKYRGLGLGNKLTKKVMLIGERHGVHYETYAANWNINSINSSISCGCKIVKIGEEFTQLTNKKRSKL